MKRGISRVASSPSLASSTSSTRTAVNPSGDKSKKMTTDQIKESSSTNSIPSYMRSTTASATKNTSSGSVGSLLKRQGSFRKDNTGPGSVQRSASVRSGLSGATHTTGRAASTPSTKTKAVQQLDFSNASSISASTSSVYKPSSGPVVKAKKALGQMGPVVLPPVRRKIISSSCSNSSGSMSHKQPTDDGLRDDLDHASIVAALYLKMKRQKELKDVKDDSMDQMIYMKIKTCDLQNETHGLKIRHEENMTMIREARILEEMRGKLLSTYMKSLEMDQFLDPIKKELNERTCLITLHGISSSSAAADNNSSGAGDFVKRESALIRDYLRDSSSTIGFIPSVREKISKVKIVMGDMRQLCDRIQQLPQLTKECNKYHEELQKNLKKLERYDQILRNPDV